MTTEHERDSLGRMELKVDQLVLTVGEVRERLAKLEALASHTAVSDFRNEMARTWEKLGALEAGYQRHELTINSILEEKKQLWARVEALEAAKNHHAGEMSASKTWGDWIYRVGPWAAAAALVVWDYFKFPH